MTAAATKEASKLQQEHQSAPRSFLRDALEVGICAAGIYACYITYGVLQEQMWVSAHARDVSWEWQVPPQTK